MNFDKESKGAKKCEGIVGEHINNLIKHIMGISYFNSSLIFIFLETTPFTNLFPSSHVILECPPKIGVTS